MRRWLLAVMIACACAAPVALARDLTEAAVQALLADLDRVITARDVDAMAALFAEDAAIVYLLRADDRVQRVTLDKPRYIQSARQIWANVVRNEYRRSEVTVNVTEPTRAVVTLTATESNTNAQGQSAGSVSRQRLVIDLIDGRALVRSVIAERLN